MITRKHLKYSFFMKRIIVLLVVGLACKGIALAQPSLTFSSAAPNVGESFCVDVRVRDFTDILSMQFSLNWDPEVIQYESVNGFGIPNLNASNFDASLGAEGKLSVNWEFAPCSPMATGVTLLEDGTVLFRLCFRALGAYGETSPIQLSNDPTPIRVTRVNACPSNIGMLAKDGLVSVGVRPLTLLASSETANAGDLVCVDFSVTGFDNMTSMQFSVNWDPAVLRFENVVVLENLVNLVEANFGTPNQPNVGAGNLTLSWSAPVPGGPGIDLADSTIIFQVCYRLIGACETSTAIRFQDSPTPFEFTNTVVEGFKLTVVTENGRVRANRCNPTGLPLIAECGPPANPNDIVCVKVNVRELLQIREFNWNLEWNENILEFVEIRNITTQLAGFNASRFNQANVSNGVLGVNWSTTSPLGASIPGGNGTLFEICFKVIGISGGSPIRFVAPPPNIPAVLRINNVDIGINPSNCDVQVIRPQGVVMQISSSEVPLGDETCLDVKVSGFTDIISYQFSLAWEPNHMEFTGIRNINLQGASMANFGLFGIDGGSLTFDWDAAQGVSLPDESTIFQVCFNAKGKPQDCDDLIVSNEPLVSEAITSSSNGRDVGVTSLSGEVCILFPEGFFLDIQDAEGERQSTVCMPVTVKSFDNITATSFTLSWEPSALRFREIRLPANNPMGLTLGNFSTTSTGVGVATLNWNSPTPVNIADDVVIFELCFDLVGSPENCYEVRVGEPTASVTTSNGAGSLLSDPGKLCIKDKIVVLDSIIKPASCPGINDGEITLVVEGGRQPVGFTWETNPPSFGPTARNLPPGPIAVTIFDNSNPAIILRDTFMIPISANLPTANAGENKNFSCDPPIVQLQGQGSQGTNFAYQWRTIGGQLAPNSNQLNTAALSPGLYILEVTNTQTGCVARDTMEVIPIDFPTADAGQDQDFGCNTESVTLNGSASSSGAGFSYLWTARDGGQLQAGSETTASPRATAPGLYILSVTNTANGCTARDSVVVRDAQVFPNANAGQDQRLECEEGSVTTLDASNSVNSETVEFQWLSLNGEVLSGSSTFNVEATGIYILKVTALISGCSALDTVQVLPSEEAPVVELATEQLLTCVQDTVTLTASISNSIDFIFEWTANGGGQFVTGTNNTLAPQAIATGTYQLVVQDTVTNCRVTSIVVVGEDKEAPIANAGDDAAQTCEDNSPTLNGSASSTGNEFTYSWTRGGEVVATGTLTPEVSIAGTYLLEVLNTRNGCTSVDSVRVVPDVDLPQAILPITTFKLNCVEDTLDIGATIQPNNPAFTIEWTAIQGGNILSGQGTPAIRVDAPGIYQIIVTNPANGCEGINEAIVEDDRDAPNAVAEKNQDITCNNATVTLNANNSAVGSDISYEWRQAASGTIIGNTVQVNVTEAGTYILSVFNAQNNCSAMDTIEVVADNNPPQIAFAAADTLSCTTESVQINATGSTPNANVTAEWTGLDGGMATLTNNLLIVQVTQGGRYELRLLNTTNGCEARDTITILADDSRPEVIIETPSELTCREPGTTLNATESRVSGTFNAVWTVVSGGGSVQPDATNPLIASVSGPGQYQLRIVRTDNGCESSSVVTLQEPDVPMSSAGNNRSISCGETATLDGSGSSSGANITYQWSVVSGGGSIANPTAPTVQTTTAGTYQLIVTNTANGCADTSTVQVTLDIQLDRANAGADLSVCAPTAALSANLPTGAAGVWTSPSGATISNPAQTATNVSNLQPGDNRFIWTLSAIGCGEYSADTVIVKLETLPIAADDALTLKAGETRGSILVTGNDNLNGVSQWTVSIVSNPTLGGISDVQGGRVGYIVKAGVFGDDQFTYKVCSNACPDLCDEAIVNVQIERDPNFKEPPRVNGITPNGDGINDRFVFEELLINPDQYPDNELIVFNRWGDIVYQARPYQNDWEGTNQNGQNLPEGTYYYILRLNISEGVIIRGDVTVIR